jgi:hypothetical protein
MKKRMKKTEGRNDWKQRVRQEEKIIESQDRKDEFDMSWRI